MPSETLTAGLQKYGIGAKLRRLRLRKGMGLLELGKHTGLSAALLSKLERGVMQPTLPTLLRIAMVFGVGLDHFFGPDPKPVFEIVRKRDRLRFPEAPDATAPAYTFESLDYPVPNRMLEAYFAEFHPLSVERVRLHHHPGVEMLYVLSGALEVHAREAAHVLDEGDSIYFDAAVPHGYRAAGDVKTTALVVTAGRGAAAPAEAPDLSKHGLSRPAR